MKTLAVLLALVFASSTPHLMPLDSSDDIVGVWATNLEDVEVEVYEKDGHYIGNPLDEDGNRNEELTMLDLEYKKDRWVGKIFVKRRNKYFDVEAQLEGEKLMLTIEAGRRTRKVEWTRAK